ncbi:MAG TPA: MBL fold metallo-hydrolase [Leeuwenhoekiella sp.]|nr:MBL fold metallo-hydrolase [Leeuwenhoekiella sp.]
MKIKQFEDKALSHFSYVIISQGKMAVVDPERDPAKYYAFAEANQAKITTIFETHPHADFISAHVQMHKETGATIYTSKRVGADYPHLGFDDGDFFSMGEVVFKAINTPGHSPDSITIIAQENDKTVLFTGDTLFIGDVGRPDLRESNGNKKATRIELAKQMYHSIQQKLNDLPDDALIYPAHGAGSLCGKGMSDASSSTLGNERQGNWAFQKQTEKEFINTLLDAQPFIPHYFGHDVDMNKAGAANLQQAIAQIPFTLHVEQLDPGVLVIDTRDEAAFKKNHLPKSINIMATKPSVKFETWLGSIVRPEEPFYLVAKTVEDLKKTLQRVAKIGYERQVLGLLTLAENIQVQEDSLNLQDFKTDTSAYTIVDIRNTSETEKGTFFKNALTIPLPELRERANEIPTQKPIVVHCAGGYRSAAGSSIVANHIDQVPVYDLGDAVKEFVK